MATKARTRTLSPAAQLFGLRSRYPEGQGELVAHGRRLCWVQWVQPHPLCGRYLIEIRLEQNGLPAVLVREPGLQALAGKRALPHVFEPVDGMPSLCLWWCQDWNRDMPLTIIVPWAAEWFWFFEHWLVTGEWLGGGSHPVPIVPPAEPAAGLLTA